MIVLIYLSYFFIYVIYFLQAVPFKLRETGRECTTSYDCAENAYCHEGRICFCNDRYLAVRTSKKTFICLKEASFIGDVCNEDIQCTVALGTHALCVKKSNNTALSSGKCACQNDSHFQDGICYKNSRIGESCTVNDNCVISSPDLVAYCDQSRCICPPFYHANNDGTDCLPSSVLGGPCKSNEDCITMNSRCINVCECELGYVMSEKKTYCLLAADKLFAPCDEDIQCSTFIENSTCDPISNQCNCRADSHMVKNACYKTARLHEPCKYDEECIIDSRNQTRVKCLNKFCLCTDNHEIFNRTDCIAIIRSYVPGNGLQLHTDQMLTFFAITLLYVVH